MITTLTRDCISLDATKLIIPPHFVNFVQQPSSIEKWKAKKYISPFKARKSPR
jgi:hypothetical protein